MKELNRIVQLIDKNKPRKIEVLGNEDATSRHAEMYNLLKDGHILTDADAALHFYGDAKAITQTAFRQFKSKFKERLINTLFFLEKDSAEASDLQNATISIQKEWAAINIIYTKGDYLLATKLAEDLLPFAIKYELTEIVVYIADRLRQSYGTQIANRIRYDELKKLQDDYMALWQLEILSRDIFHDIRMDYIKSSALQSNTIEKAQKGWTVLQPLLKNNPSYQYLTHSYAVGIAQYTSSTQDLEATICICDEAIATLALKPFKPKKPMTVFMNQKIRCYTQLKNQIAGEKAVNEALLLHEEGSVGWFKTLEYQTLLALHTQTYDAAFQIWQMVQNHKAFKVLTLQHSEMWRLFGAYLHFLTVSSKVKTPTALQSKFKSAKFVNEIPTFSTDKEGMNVPSLIIQIAILIAEKKTSSIPDRLEALNKYWRRHLRKTDTSYRSHCFIKMLQELPKANYNRLRLEVRTKTMLRDLTAVPYDAVSHDFKSEIIPLEDLWAILLSLM
jgi:hypothetical protein